MIVLTGKLFTCIITRNFHNFIPIDYHKKDDHV